MNPKNTNYVIPIINFHFFEIFHNLNFSKSNLPFNLLILYLSRETFKLVDFCITCRVDSSLGYKIQGLEKSNMGVWAPCPSGLGQFQGHRSRKHSLKGDQSLELCKVAALWVGIWGLGSTFPQRQTPSLNQPVV